MLENVNGGFNSGVFSISVSAKDTLSKIAKRYGVSLARLRKLNNLLETDSLENKHNLLIPYEKDLF